MRIGINARLLAWPSLRGWSRYTINLLMALADLGVRCVLYMDAPPHAVHEDRLRRADLQIRMSPRMRYTAWEQVWLPLQCALDGVDVLHTPFNFGVPWVSRCPRVLTLHDAITQVYEQRMPLRARLKREALVSRWRHWAARARAQRIITVSDHARGDLESLLGVASGKISVIHEAADPIFERPVSPEAVATVLERYGLRQPYVFYVGGWEERKNIPFLLRAFRLAQSADVRLVLAGGTPAQRAGLEAEVRSDEKIDLLGWVPDEDLPCLYAGAQVFVYPSSYEGFGLQLCEAMAVGCPVLAADAASLPEVLDAGGETFGLSDPSSLSQLLTRLAGDGAFVEELARKSRERGRAFSWRRTAEETLAVYERVLRARGRR